MSKRRKYLDLGRSRDELGRAATEVGAWVLALFLIWFFLAKH